MQRRRQQVDGPGVHADEHRVDLGEGMSNLSSGPPPIAENCDRAYSDRRPPGHDELRAVGGDEKDSAAGGDSGVYEPAGDNVHRTPVRFEGDPTVSAYQVGAIGPPSALIKEVSNPTRPRLPNSQRVPVDFDGGHLAAPRITNLHVFQRSIWKAGAKPLLTPIALPCLLQRAMNLN
jgi:hypothetical protein